MKLLILEYLCGGCWEETELPESLSLEGWLMLKAALLDAAQIPDVEVFTTWDIRSGIFPLADIQCTLINSPQHFISEFSRLLNTVDQVLLIAPEFDHKLFNLALLVEKSPAELIGPSSQIIKLTSSKLQTKAHLKNWNIPTTVETPVNYSTRDQITNHEPVYPFILKQDDGAGCIDNWLIRNKADYQSYLQNSPANRTSMICEQFLEGEHYSMGVIINQAGHLDLLPLVSQHINFDLNFSYQGGHLPVKNVDEQPFRDLVTKCVDTFKGLHGYLGIDMIAPHSDPQNPVIVEINPRLTTSYVGYRQLTQINLMDRILSRESQPDPIIWNDNSISWDVHQVH